MIKALPDLITLSCFAGIGGTELACQAVGGFKVVDAIEKNPYRQQVLKKNFPELNVFADIRDFTTDTYYDLIVTTFPCKGFSNAGKGKGYENEYSALWWESYRLIKDCKPSFVVIENVRGFLQRGADLCFGALRLAGYVVDNPEIVSAKEVGACHQRERVFIVAYRSADTDGIERTGELPSPWARQIGDQIKAVRGEGAVTYAPGFGQSAQPQPPCLPGEEWLATRKSRQATAEGAWIKSGRSSVSCTEVDSPGPQFPSFDQGVVDGLSPQLDQYRRGGWWLDNPFYGSISAPKRSVSDRQKRISALGDSVTPQQMAVPLMRVKYLQEFFY